MKHLLRLVLAIVVIGAAGALAWRAWAPRGEDRDLLTGYVEGDDLYLSSPAAGTVAQVREARGQRVQPGAELFAMDPATLSAQQGQAQARVQQARAQIEAAAGQVAQARANVAAARAAQVQAARDLARYLALQKTNPLAVSGQQLDAAREQAQSAAAQLSAAEQAASAQAAQVQAARAGEQQAAAGARESGVRLGQLTGRAPTAGRIEDVFFQSGEWAAANQPVVALLPDEKIKVRFFVPEQSVQLYGVGRAISFSCDGCRGPLHARIDYVSPRPEFTPPIIYSRKTRDKLVFMVEARPERPAALTPGLPVDVTPVAGAPGRPR